MIDFEKIENYVKESLKNDKTGHDFEHTKRVLKIAEEIAKTEEVDEIIGKGLGAKEYIKKPFSFQELKRIVEKHI